MCNIRLPYGMKPLLRWRSSISRGNQVRSRFHAFIENIITNIAFVRISFLVLCSAVSYRLNVAFFLCQSHFTVPCVKWSRNGNCSRKLKREVLLWCGHCWACCYFLWTCQSCAFTRCVCVCVCVSCRIILTVLEGKILVRHVLQLY